MKIHRLITHSIRQGGTWHERWASEDLGLIVCWERGREKRCEEPALAAKAEAGQLVILPWKGGLERAIKARKYGSFQYLAMWQGLRGGDLDIDPDVETHVRCTATGMLVTFTSDASRYAQEED